MKLGITGHQDIGNDATIAWVKEEMLREINKLNIEKAYSSLAIGADQLFATLVLREQIPLTVVIPSNHYEKTFSNGKLEIFHSLLQQASEIIHLKYEEPSEIAFYEAGKCIVNNTDIIFAVWNNKRAKGLGGTADVVAYAKLQNKRVVHLNLIFRTIRYINMVKYP